MAEPSASVRQQQAAATRLQLLAAAAEVFDERGYQAASVGAITDRATTAHGTFYLYFKNKEDAFCQVMEAVIIEELAAATRLPVDVQMRDGIEIVIRRFLAAHRPRAGLWRALLEAMLQSPRVQDLWLDLRRNFVHRVAAVLEDECARGRTRPLDPLMTAHALAAMTEWFAFMHFSLDEPPAPDSQVDPDSDHAVAVLVDLWHHALYGRL